MRLCCRRYGCQTSPSVARGLVRQAMTSVARVVAKRCSAHAIASTHSYRLYKSLRCGMFCQMTQDPERSTVRRTGVYCLASCAKAISFHLLVVAAFTVVPPRFPNHVRDFVVIVCYIFVHVDFFFRWFSFFQLGQPPFDGCLELRVKAELVSLMLAPGKGLSFARPYFPAI